MSETKPEKKAVSPRHRSRELALQGIYQWRVSQTDVAQIEAHTLGERGLGHFDKGLFSKLLRGTLEKMNELEALITPHIDRGLTELSPVELSVMLLGTYELSSHIDTPYRVIINESVELAKTFGGTDGHKYVNGVLDKLAAQLRSDEVNQKRTPR